MPWQPSVPTDSGASRDTDYLTWEDGETKSLVILSDQPQYHAMHWVSGKPEPCTGANCVWCGSGIRVSQRYTVRVEIGGVQKLWEMAGLTWKDLAEKAIMAEQLRGLKMRVKRSGLKRNTRYVTFVETKIDPDELPDPDPFTAGITAKEEPSRPDPEVKYADQLRFVRGDLDGATKYIKAMMQTMDMTMDEFIARTAGYFGNVYHQRDANHQMAMIIHYLDSFSKGETVTVSDDQAAASLAALIG